MNWLEKIWKALNEPVPSQAPPGETPATRAKARPFRPTHSEATTINFTPRAQQVLSLARKEADRFNHNFVGTEHLLLGLIALGQGVAVNVLQRLGLDLKTVRAEIEKQVGTGPDQKMIGNIPYTPRVKKVLSLAAKEAKVLNHTYVGTEHLLLGLMCDGDGVAARVLQNLNVNVEQTRREILKELDPNFSSDPDEPNITAASPARPTVAAPAESERPKKTILIEPTVELIDVRPRYDVYCSERNQDVVVYRNALFKGVKRLFREDRDWLADFYEIEQADGQTIFIAKYSVIKFCEPGITPSGENVPGKQP